MKDSPTITTTATRSGVTSEDAAAYLKISTGTIYVLVARGAVTALPQGLPGDRLLLLDRDSVIAYRAKRRYNRRWHSDSALAEAR